jgi:hypothetical protein
MYWKVAERCVDLAYAGALLMPIWPSSVFSRSSIVSTVHPVRLARMA